MEWDNEFDQNGYPSGLESVFLAASSADNAQFTGAAKYETRSNNGGTQSYNIPVCSLGDGSECQAAAYWRKRCEETIPEISKRMVELNNLAEDNKRLEKRLADSEKSVHMYQQKLFDSLMITEPLRTEIDELKNRMITEIREKAEYQCSAESSKAIIGQLKAYNEKVEGEREDLRQKVHLLEVKFGDLKRTQDKAAAMQAKFEKVKQQLKEKTDENASLKKELEKFNLIKHEYPHLFQRRRRRLHSQHNQLLDIGDGSTSSQSGDEEHSELVEALEEQLARDQTDRNAESIQQRPVAPINTPQMANTGIGATKAMMVLQRKELQEAEGTYSGTKKYMFCDASRRFTRSAAANNSDDGGGNTEKVDPKTKSMRAKMSNQPITLGGLTAEGAIEQVLHSLSEFMEPPMSPVPDLPAHLISQDTLPVDKVNDLGEMESSEVLAVDQNIGESQATHDVTGSATGNSSEVLAINQNVGGLQTTHDVTGSATGNSSESLSIDQIFGESQTTHGVNDNEVEPPAGDNVIETTTSNIVNGDAAAALFESPIEYNANVSVLNTQSHLSPQYEENTTLVIDEGETSQTVISHQGNATSIIEARETSQAVVNHLVQDGGTSLENCAVENERNETVVGEGFDTLASETAAAPLLCVQSQDQRLDHEMSSVELKQDETPIRKKRGRPPAKSVDVASPVKKQRMPVSSTRRSLTCLHKGISQASAKDIRSCGAVLDLLLSGPGISNASAFEKWMKNKTTSVTVASCFIEAIKRHNAVPWIATQLKPHGQTDMVSRILLSRGVASSTSSSLQPSGLQALSLNDKKLADFLEILLRNVEEWRNVPDIMLSEIKRQLASMKETTFNQKEALCRWSFYLARKKGAIIEAQDILLGSIRRDDSIESKCQPQWYQSVLYLFLTAAMVWPEAFQKLVLEDSGVSQRILQKVFYTSVWKIPSLDKKMKIQNLLERCGANSKLVPFSMPDQEPTFDVLIREQLTRLSCLNVGFALTNSGISMPIEMASCVNVLQLLAPYCDDQALSMIVQPSLISIKQWYAISADDALARGGINQLVSDILWLSIFSSFYQDAMVENFGALLMSLRAMVFRMPLNETEGLFVVTGTDRMLLIYSAFEFFIRLPDAVMFGQKNEIQNILKGMLAILEKEAVDEDCRLAKENCRKMYTDFCKRQGFIM